MTISKTDSVFTVENTEIYDIDVVVKQLNTEGVFVTIDQDKTIVSTFTDSWTLTDGEYIFEKYNSGTEAFVASYKVLVFETTKACVLAYIADLLAELPYGDDCEPKRTNRYFYNYVSVQSLYFAYISILNKIMVDNYVFSTLSGSELVDLQRAKELREGINKVCDSCLTSK